MTVTSITIPDLRFEEALKARMHKKIVDSNNRNHIKDTHYIPKSLIIQSLIVDQLIMPFLQSFFLTGFLFYVRPLLRLSGSLGYSVGSSIVARFKSLGKTIFFFGNSAGDYSPNITIP